MYKIYLSFYILVGIDVYGGGGCGPNRELHILVVRRAPLGVTFVGGGLAPLGVTFVGGGLASLGVT